MEDKLYRVYYSFEGEGYVDINAESAESAEEAFYEGDFSEEHETGSNYVVEDTQEVNDELLGLVGEVEEL